MIQDVPVGPGMLLHSQTSILELAAAGARFYTVSARTTCNSPEMGIIHTQLYIGYYMVGGAPSSVLAPSIHTVCQLIKDVQYFQVQTVQTPILLAQPPASRAATTGASWPAQSYGPIEPCEQSLGSKAVGLIGCL